MRDRQLLTVDEAGFIDQAQRIAEKVNTFLAKREEYLPDEIKEITRHRRRFHIMYKGVRFEINLDRLLEPKHDQQARIQHPGQIGGAGPPPSG